MVTLRTYPGRFQVPGINNNIKKPSGQMNGILMDLPPFFQRILPGDFVLTPPVATLLAANLITIVLAVIEGWDLASVLFIYWAQSIIIGIFTIITLLTAGTTPPASGGRTSWKVRIFLAGFFMLHYGAFHWGYYSIIVEDGIFGPVDFTNTGLWASCGLFFANHLYSFLYHRGIGEQPSLDPMEIFFRPYNRIVPMHMTIIFGGIVVLVLGFLGITTVMPVLVIFLAIKTYVDIGTHVQKHRVPGDPDKRPLPFVF
jgi:hypothetical protein